MEFLIKMEWRVNGVEYEKYYGSLSAIFDYYTPEQVGANLNQLWAAKIEVGKPYRTSKCVISKHCVYRKKHKN